MTDHKELRERATKLLSRYPTHVDGDLIRDLLTALDEQQKVLDRSPVTADGLRVHLGMTVYVWVAGLQKVARRTVISIGESGGLLSAGSHGAHAHSWGECYSTREAAEAAKEVADD